MYFISMVNFLFLGEIVSKPGVEVLRQSLDDIKKRYEIDYTIVNAEGMTGGFGIGKMHSLLLGKLGINISTGGEKLFFKIDMVEHIKKASYMLRPFNMPPECPGRGYRIIELKDRKFLIANIIGNADFQRVHAQNALLSADVLKKKAEEENAILLIFFHASATAEKNTMLYFLDGKAAAVIGTHTKVLTADGKITENGTAYISDNGRVGSFLSVGGFEPELEIRKLKSAMPIRSRECWEDPRLQGVVVSIDELSGKAVGIKVLNESVNLDGKREE